MEPWNRKRPGFFLLRLDIKVKRSYNSSMVVNLVNWMSGLNHFPAKEELRKLGREFESHIHRQKFLVVVLDIKLKGATIVSVE